MRTVFNLLLSLRYMQEAIKFVALTSHVFLMGNLIARLAG